jgi:predicted RND superfamily exporter protein
MKDFENALGAWVIRYRLWIILATILLTVISLQGASHLSMTTNYRVFFSEDNPQLLAFEALEKTYAKNDNVLFVLTPKNGKVFSPQALKAIVDLTDQAWQIPFSTRVDSLSNFQYTHADGDDLVVEDLITEPENLSPAELADKQSIALAEPLLLDRLINPAASVTGINITIQLPGKDPTAENPAVVLSAREIAGKIRDSYPDMEVRLAGMVMMNYAFTEASINDFSMLVPISYGLMLIFLTILIRSITGTVITLLVIILSVITALGTGGWIGYPITPPTTSTPVIILTIAIASSVHLLVTFFHELHKGNDRFKSISETLRINFQPIALTSFTTALGFLSMNFSEVPPFRQLGNMVSIGVIASFFLVIFFMPAILSFIPLRPKMKESDNDPVMITFSRFVIKNRRILLYSMSAFILILLAFIPRNELNDIFVHYFDKDITFRQDVDYATENLTGTYILDYSLESGQSGGISNPGFLADVENFANWFRQQEETIHVNTITDIIKRLNRNMHADQQEKYLLPDSRELSAQYLLLYEMSLPLGLDLNNQINVDKSSTRFVVTLKILTTNHMLELEQRASDWLEKNTTHITRSEGSGPTIMFAHIGKRNIKSMLMGTTVALVLISLVLIIAFRSVKMGLISMIPNLVPAGMGFGLWGIFVGEVGLALAVVTGMTLGIVVDDTVHLMSKYLRARREQGLNTFDSVQYAFNTVGRALVITSIVLVAGFLVLALSSFKLNSGMGLLTAIIIAFALLADFFLLPPLLMKLEEKKNA